MSKVVGKIVGANSTENGVIDGVKVILADGREVEAVVGMLLHEGDRLVSQNPNIIVEVKYLALAETSTYEGVFTVLADGAVIAPAEIADSVFDAATTADENAGEEETAAGDMLESSSTPYISMSADIQDSDVVALETTPVVDTQATTTTNITPTIATTLTDNSAPEFTSPAEVIYDENNANTIVVSATDTVSTVAYSIAPGEDSELFTIDAATGELSFITPPDYENPQDIGNDNQYNVTVVARDAVGNESTQRLSIYINNLNDNNPVTEDITVDTIEDTATFSGNLVAVDADGNALEFVVTSEPQKGTLNVDTQTGTFTYTLGDEFEYLAEGESTTVTFTYKAVEADTQQKLESTPDSTVTITITGTNDQPVVEDVVVNGNETWLLGATTTPSEPSEFNKYYEVKASQTASVEEVNAFIESANDSVTIADLGANYNPTDGSAIKFSIQGVVGETVSFIWVFNDSEGYIDSSSSEMFYRDFSFIVIDGESIEVLADTFEDGVLNSGIFTYTFNDSNVHEITFGVFNDKDTLFDSSLEVSHLFGGEIVNVENIGYVELLTTDYLSENNGVETIYNGVLEVSDVDVTDTHIFKQIGKATVETNSEAEVTDFSVVVKENGIYHVTGNFDALAEGEKAVITFEYQAIDDSATSNAASDVAKVTLVVVGTNDQPVVVEALTDVALQEDTVGNNVIAAQGYFAQTTEDSMEDSWVVEHLGGDLQVLMNSEEFDTFLKLYDADGNLIVTNDDGGVGYNSVLLVDELPAGSYTVVATGALDEFGPYQIDFLTPLNVVTQPDGAQVADALYNTLSAEGSVIFEDLDTTDTHTITVDSVTTNYGTLVATEVEQGVVTWEYNVVNDLVEYLAEGETRVETFNVVITDNHGASAIEEVSVTITGTNDTPEISPVYTTATAELTENVDNALFMSDNTQTGSNDEYIFNHEGGAITITMNSGEFDTYLLIYDANGNLVAENDDGAYESNAQLVLTDLPAGEYKVVASGYWDEAESEATGSTVYQSGPYEILFEPAVDFTSYPEGAIANNFPVLIATGEVVFTEIDATDTHQVKAVAQGDTLGTLQAILSEESEFGTGVVEWNYIVNNSDVDYLAEGETKVETFKIYIEDNNGATVEQDVTVTITGTNDQPVVESVVENISETDFVGSIEVDGITINNITYASQTNLSAIDADSSDTHTISRSTYSSNFGLNEGVALGVTFTESNPGILEIYQAAAYNSEAFVALKNTVIITLEKSDILSSIIEHSTTATNLLENIENTTSLDELENVINNTPGFGIERIYAENGTVIQSVEISAEATEAQYIILEENHVAQIVVNDDGSYSLSTPFVDALAGDESVNVTFAYSATDSQGASSAPATVTLVVDGDNDAPIVGTVDSNYAVLGMFDIDGGNVDLGSVVAMQDELPVINGVVLAGRTELNISYEDVLDVVANPDHMLSITSNDDFADAVHLDDNFDKENPYDNGDGTHTYVGSIDTSDEIVLVTIEDTIIVD
jgi:VCBS repeat-containing protein